MCGVLGIISKNSRSSGELVLKGLLTLQHRGQDAAGILSFDKTYNKFSLHKDLGLVNEVFRENHLKDIQGEISIGHTRYATTGSDNSTDIQPLVTGFPYGIGMAHNGNIVNYHQLAKKLTENNSQQLLTNNDLEIFLSLWCSELVAKKNSIENIMEASSSIIENAIGAYSIVGIFAGVGLFGLRDPNGIRPLILGKKVDTETKEVQYMLSSESSTLNFLDFEYVRDVEPGEFVLIDTEGQVHSKKHNNTQIASKPCMFEWVYFSSAESSIEGKSVYQKRLNLGVELAREIKPYLENKSISPDVVCPVPDTARTAAIAISESLGIPYRECFIKNRYVQRSFILKSKEQREKAVELKLAPILSEIKGKSILLVDDSLVRGTTSKRIISMLKKHGAREVSFALTCPPIRYGCFYGVDFPKKQDLIANERSVEQIETYIDANKLIFLSAEGLKKALKIDTMCDACISGKYPTPISDAEEFIEKRDHHRNLTK